MNKYSREMFMRDRVRVDLSVLSTPELIRLARENNIVLTSFRRIDILNKLNKGRDWTRKAEGAAA